MSANESAGGNETNEDFVLKCENVKLYEDLLKIFFLLPFAILIVFVISFLTRRKQLLPGCCWKRPGVVYPINFIDDSSRRWAYVAVFLILTYDIINLLKGEYIWNPIPSMDAAWQKKYGWVRVFVKLGNTIHECFLYYPLLACLTKRRNIIANILGFIYIIPWILLDMSFLFVCKLEDEEGKSKLSGEVRVAVGVPILLFHFVVMFAYVLDFGVNIRLKCKARKTSESTRDLDPAKSIDFKLKEQLLYVNHLMNRKPKPLKPIPRTFLEKMKAKLLTGIKAFTYQKIIGFQYSSRVLCTLSVAIFVIFAVLVTAILETLDEYPVLVQLIEWFKTEFSIPKMELVDNIVELIYVNKYLFIIANCLSAFLQLVFIGHMLITYKKRIHQLFCGNHKWYRSNAKAPAKVLLCGLKYSGYQVAFVMYGYTILMAILWLILNAIAAISIFPEVRHWVLDKINDLWPTVLIGLVIYYTQIFLCKYCFLQEKGAFLAMNNRRLYHVFAFFMFIFNVIIGIFACFKRVLISLAIGVVFISRLDRVLFMRGFEKFDAGYSAYLAMLSLEVYQSHPVLKAFAHLLTEVTATREADAKEGLDEEEIKRRQHSKRLRNRWFKLVTLMNNPSIVLDRLYLKTKQLQLEKQHNYPNTGKFEIPDIPMTCALESHSHSSPQKTHNDAVVPVDGMEMDTLYSRENQYEKQPLNKQPV